MRIRTFYIGLAILCAGVTSPLAGPTPQGDSGRGAELYAASCSGCHGQDGNSPTPSFPKLAGQYAEYLVQELKAFQDGVRPSEMMLEPARTLDEQGMADIALFLAKLPPSPGTVTDASLLPLGKKVYLEGNPDTGVPSCDGCHEENGEGSKRFPRLAGQSVEYSLEQFRLYASGKRPHGKKVMRTVAERLTEKEARAVAEYIASLP